MYLNSNDRLVFRMDTKCVLCELTTELLCIIQKDAGLHIVKH